MKVRALKRLYDFSHAVFPNDFSHEVLRQKASKLSVEQGSRTDLTRLAGRAEPCRGAFSELRSFRRGRKGQPPKEAEYFYHYFVQPLTFLVCVFSSKFWYHLAPFWLDFGLRGVPGEPLGTLCGTPVAQGAQKCNF